MKGRVFNIQRYSVHDGPGIRTIVFLKGCHLRCKWCANPESQSKEKQLSYNAQLCIGDQCLMCQAVCKEQAIFFPGAGPVEINRERCSSCMQCVSICPPKALSTFGEDRDVEDVLAEVEEDLLFYRRGQGGLTLSGGEPLLQADFAAELLRQAQESGIHTAIETCGYAPRENLEKVVKYCDHVLFDIKSLDEEKHRQYTGVSNTVILENFQRLVELIPPSRIRVRTPVIPGFNDTVDDLQMIRAFVQSVAPDAAYELLKYHRYGENKYRFLGRDYSMGEVELSDEQFASFKQAVHSV